MENKENMVYVPLEQYNKGVVALAKIEALAAYMEQWEYYSLDKKVVAGMLGIELKEGNDDASLPV